MDIRALRSRKALCAFCSQENSREAACRGRECVSRKYRVAQAHDRLCRKTIGAGEMAWGGHGGVQGGSAFESSDADGDQRTVLGVAAARGRFRIEFSVSALPGDGGNIRCGAE